MSTQRSAVALRTILCDSQAQISAINTSILPEGATAYEAASGKSWRLFKSLGDTYDDLISTYILRGSNQSSARWVLEGAQGINPYYAQTYLGTQTTVTIADNTWVLLGTTTGNYNFADFYADGSAFQLTDNNVLTYLGPTRTVQVMVNLTMLSETTTPSTIYGVIRRNTDVVVGSTTSYAIRGQGAVGVSSADAGQLRLDRIVSLTRGTTLTVALRNITSTEDLTVPFYSMILSPL